MAVYNQEEIINYIITSKIKKKQLTNSILIVTFDCGNVTFRNRCSKYISDFYHEYLCAHGHMEFKYTHKNAGLILITGFILLPKIAYCLLGMLELFQLIISFSQTAESK